MVVRKLGPPLREPVAQGVEIVSWFDLDGRLDGLQLQCQQTGDRHFVYLAHNWACGVSVVDVTNPARPFTASFIPSPNDSTRYLKVQVADDIAMMSCDLSTRPGARLQDLDPGVRFYDVSAPSSPKEISFYRTEGTGAHRCWWNGGRYAYVSACKRAPGLKMHGELDMTRVLTILDLADPSRPEKVSEYWLPEQRGEGRRIADGETVYVHQPVVEGDRAYVAYWDAGFAILDITDRANLRLISRYNTFPWLSDGNTHTVVPLPARNLLVVIEEATANYGCEGDHNIWLFDVTDETNLGPISKFPVPTPSKAEPYSSYAERGDRFGPHCLHENHSGTLRCDDRVYATYCNAGLRIYDITNERFPREIGSFVPPDPVKIVDPRPYERMYDVLRGGTRVACTQDVLVDPRGYIYISGTNDGLWILKETV